MLRAIGQTQDGRPLVLLGVDPENIRRLQDGKPILVDMAEYGINACITIVYGPSVAQIVRSLRAAGIAMPDSPLETET